jgi:sugar/nucleoside kinase (ribokinase family)
LSSSDRRLDLIVAGDCNPDLIVTGDDLIPAFGQAEKLVSGMSLVIGGSASITAVAAARLGLRVALVAAVGDDPAGQLIRSLLADEGVDISFVAVRQGLATGMTAVLSAGADRAILTALGAMTTVTAADIPGDLLARARHLHVSAYFLLAGSLGTGLGALFATARDLGLGTSLDPNYDPAGRWADRRLRTALAQTDLFLPNETEACGIGGEHMAGPAAAALASAGPHVVVKLGARGALCVPARPAHAAESGTARAGTARAGTARAGTAGAGTAAGRPRSARPDWVNGVTGPRLVSVPRVRPVDSTGAGDCFNAGVIMGLLDGLDLPHAVAVGCAAGAASTAAVGGTGAVLDRQRTVSQAALATISPAEP